MLNPLRSLGRSCAVLVGLAVALAMCMPAAAAAGQAPPLGEVARKEQQRRKALPTATKVYTNKDLPDTAQKPASPPVAAEPPAEGGAPEAAPAAPQDPKSPADDEAAWRQRMATAREGLRRSEMFAEALQTRINSLNRDFQSRDDPAQRSRIGADRAEALNELARVRQEIEAQKKEIADIEEEARRAGVPPGWLR